MQSSGRVALQALALDMMTAYLHAVSDTIDLHCVNSFANYHICAI